jgi:uncharacterized protein YjgD (DUF1641 family)
MLSFTTKHNSNSSSSSITNTSIKVDETAQNKVSNKKKLSIAKIMAMMSISQPKMIHVGLKNMSCIFFYLI